MTNSKAQLPYNPAILKWARNRTGMEIAEVSKKIRVPERKIIQWESGTATPTTRQGHQLAIIYDRHFLEFFFDNIPNINEVQLVPDFRTFSNSAPLSVKEKYSMMKLQRWVEEQRLNALALIDEIGQQPPVFSDRLNFDIHTDVEIAAETSRKLIGFEIAEQLNSGPIRTKLPEILRDKIEMLGVLVLKHSKITNLGARGICYFADPLPVIVYGKESRGAQAFTIIHELGHVHLNLSGISGQPKIGEQTNTNSSDIEDWCNRFASAFLIPKNSIEHKINKPKRPMDSIEIEQLNSLSDMFGTSRHAMLIRLVCLGYVNSKFYWKTMRHVFLKEEKKLISYGRPKYYGKRYINSQGRYYTGLVMTAWSGGFISAHNAAAYMGIKNLDHLKSIREDYGF